MVTLAMVTHCYDLGSMKKKDVSLYRDNPAMFWARYFKGCMEKKSGEINFKTFL